MRALRCRDDAALLLIGPLTVGGTALQAAYDAYGEAYRRWWGPIIAPSAIGLLGQLEPLVAKNAPLDIVDVGTGTATLALAALERWPRATATGVDPSSRMLQLAREEARARGDHLADRLRLLEGHAHQLPLADASIDAAVSSFVIQLVPSRAAALRDIYRVLRPGGVCAVLTWQAEDDPFEPDDVLDRVLEALRLERPTSGGDSRPYRSTAAAAAEFRRAGFGAVRARVEWLEHQYSVDGYIDLLEHWHEDELFASLARPMRSRLRTRLRWALAALEPGALLWRRPLISVVARR